MIATRGYNTPEHLVFLGVKFSDIPNSLAAVNKVPGFGSMQFIFLADVTVGARLGQDYHGRDSAEWRLEVRLSMFHAFHATRSVFNFCHDPELRRQQGPAAVPHSPRLDRSFSRRHLQTGVIDRFLEGSSGSACSNGPTGKSREEEVRVRRSTTQACLPRPQNVEAAKPVIESKLGDENVLSLEFDFSATEIHLPLGLVAEIRGNYFKHSPVCMHAAVEMFAQQCITLHGMLLYWLQPVVMLKEINNGRDPEGIPPPG